MSLLCVITDVSGVNFNFQVCFSASEITFSTSIMSKDNNMPGGRTALTDS